MLMSAAMVTAGLSGCGSQTTETNTSTAASESQEESSSVEEASSSEAEDTSEEDKTITVSVQTGEGVEAGWKAVAKAYTDLHPDVNVVIDLKSSDGYDQWLNNVFATYETTSVDIVNINLAAEAATNKSINYADYVDNDSPYSDGTWKEQFAYDKQQLGAGDGSFNALSLESVQVLWLYNQDIFDEVGIVGVPETWSELIEDCEKIEAAGYQAIAMPGDYDSFYSGTMGWLAQVYADQTTRSTVSLWQSQEGDYTYDPDVDAYYEYDPSDPFNDDTTYVTRNPVRFYQSVYNEDYTVITPGMKTVWSNFADVFPKYAGGDVMFGTNKDGAKALFYQGKAAMWVNGGWAIVGFANDMEALANGEEITIGDEAVDAKSFTLGTFNMPSMEGEGIEAKARTIEVANGFIGCVSKTQAHDDLVVDFLMYYSSSDGMSVYLDAALADGLVPNGPSLVYGVEYPEEIANAFANLTMIGNCQKDYGQALARGLAEIPESYRAFYNYCYDYLNGKITVDNFLEQHEQNIRDYFEQAMTNAQIGYSDLENPANEPTGN
jgi:ABC-type glycerol-3-phosphate transport system substrate-binding protein